MKTNKAFSLIELSIVILIIGILVAGVTQGSRLVGEMKLSSGRSLTKSSDVASMANLTLWLETTSETAVTSATNGNNPSDLDKISSWDDSNPQSLNKINLTQSTDAARPVYIANGINGLPSIKFESTSDFLQTTTTPIGAGDDDYTMVIVWRATTMSGTQVLMGQGTNTTLNNAQAMFATNNTQCGFAGYFNDSYTNPCGLIGNSNYATVMVIDNSLTNNVWIYNNSNTSVPAAGVASSGGAANLNLGADRLVIHAHPMSMVIQSNEMLVSEVIVFDRALKKSEIKAVNGYLGKKYGIAIQ